MGEIVSREEQEEYAAQTALNKQLRELLRKIQYPHHLSNLVDRVEDRLREVCFTELDPKSSKKIDHETIHLLDYIWNLTGDRSWSSKQEEPFRPRALDYFLGRKVEHAFWGTGEVVRVREGNFRTGKKADYGIRIRMKCGVRGCRNRMTVYAKPGCHLGAFCYIFDRDGKYLIDLRNQYLVCKPCVDAGRRN